MPRNREPPNQGHPLGIYSASDQRFTVWLVARNARTLLTRPHRFFDGEHCHPASRTLALTDPGVTVGILGIPGYLLTRDPVATFNLVWLTITLLAAFAMYLLVREWTGVPAAGIVAGLLYAFHTVKLFDVVHPYIDDTGWTVLAMWFATRWFQRGRRRDAAGLALCCALQIAGSPYPLIAAAMIAVPVTVWLLVRHGVRRLRPAQLAMLLVLLGATSWAVFHPFLAWRAEGVLSARTGHLFQAWSSFLPGGKAFPGWTMLGLAALGLALGRRRAVGEERGDPRWALLIAGLLTLAMATGGSAGEMLQALGRGGPTPTRLPNLYTALKGFVPGLDLVRVPAAIDSGVHLTVSALAGVGAAALIRAAPPRLALYVCVALIAVVYVDVLRPRTLGLEPRTEYAMFSVRPSQETLEFFRNLEERGNSGPIFEVPTKHTPWAASRAILLSAYHNRRTSQCFGSFHPPIADRVRALGPEMPGLEPLRELREMGFTTVLVHHGPYGAALRRAFERFAAAHGDALRPVQQNERMSAYSIEPR